MSDWPIAIAQGWHPVAALSELPAQRPLAARLLGQPLVLFRSGENVTVLRDRCPHRGAPLSQGQIQDGAITCPYHGWRFDGEGRCIEIPGAQNCPAISAGTLPVRIEAGLIWTSLAADPPDFPRLPDAMQDTALDRFWWLLAPSEAGLLDALENHLDPAHPHFLHPWLVRAPDKRRPVSVEIREGPWGAEAIYVEERRNRALLSAVMEGQRARSIGRLWPPTIGEVRFEAARGAMLSIAVIFVPVDTGMTRPLAHFASTRGWLPAWLKRAALKAFHWPILCQDRRMLRLQQRNRTQEPYVMGPLDVLAPAIWRHANAEPCPEKETQRELRL
ncbi:MAG TPA: aromatic ring-hydroxylating dioxygenase subunit alpha [Sphingomonadaceae bacterium]|nr:aromatic ring-hydroxylating dioxygenase subunit alpha [Sphingomonadaceae bacterium]